MIILLSYQTESCPKRIYYAEYNTLARAAAVQHMPHNTEAAGSSPQAAQLSTHFLREISSVAPPSGSYLRMHCPAARWGFRTRTSVPVCSWVMRSISVLQTVTCIRHLSFRSNVAAPIFAPHSFHSGKKSSSFWNSNILASLNRNPPDINWSESTPPRIKIGGCLSLDFKGHEGRRFDSVFSLLLLTLLIRTFFVWGVFFLDKIAFTWCRPLTKQCRESNLGRLGGKHECCLCATLSPFFEKSLPMVTIWLYFTENQTPNNRNKSQKAFYYCPRKIFWSPSLVWTSF